MRSNISLLCLIAGTLPAVAAAQTERQHSAHVHGRTDVAIAHEAGRFELELHAPGMDVVGFEHAPRDPGQQARIDQAIATFEDAGRWLAFQPADACTVVSVRAHTHGYADSDDDKEGHGHDDDHGHHHGHGHDHGHHDKESDDDDHEHKHEHDHDHHGDHGHGEFHVRLAADCAGTPTAIRLTLHGQFPGMELIRVDAINDNGQGRTELAPGRSEVALP